MDLEREKYLLDIEYELICELIKLRKDANISQQQLADECNVIRTTIARIENGINSPQLRTMISLLDSLGYTLKIVKKN